jgi:hypothetical protein
VVNPNKVNRPHSHYNFSRCHNNNPNNNNNLRISFLSFYKICINFNKLIKGQIIIHLCHKIHNKYNNLCNKCRSEMVTRAVNWALNSRCNYNNNGLCFNNNNLYNFNKIKCNNFNNREVKLKFKVWINNTSTISSKRVCIQ